MTFITDNGLHYNKYMSFVPKNTSAPYQKLVNIVFVIGKKVEAHIDDMDVKTSESKTHKQGLQDIFDRLLKVNMKLNPFKWSFR